MVYVWVKIDVNTHNRDRRGGHKCTDIYDDVGWDYNTPVQRKLQKRKANKQRRREHARITREAVHSWEQDAQWDVMDTIDYELDYDYYYDPIDGYYYYDSYDEEPYEDYYDPHDYDYMDDYYSFHHEYRPYDPMHDRFVQKEDVGKTLAEVLEEYTSRR